MIFITSPPPSFSFSQNIIFSHLFHFPPPSHPNLPLSLSLAFLSTLSPPSPFHFPLSPESHKYLITVPFPHPFTSLCHQKVTNTSSQLPSLTLSLLSVTRRSQIPHHSSLPSPFHFSLSPESHKYLITIPFPHPFTSVTRKSQIPHTSSLPSPFHSCHQKVTNTSSQFPFPHPFTSLCHQKVTNTSSQFPFPHPFTPLCHQKVTNTSSQFPSLTL